MGLVFVLLFVFLTQRDKNTPTSGDSQQTTSTSETADDIIAIDEPAPPVTEPSICSKYDTSSKILNFAGKEDDEVSNGRIDPSIETDPATGRLWMTYTGVKGGPLFGKSFRLPQRLAFSDDGGASWCDHSTLVPVEDIPTNKCPPNQNGRCNFDMEVSSLVYVPFAPPETRWKYFYYQVPSMEIGGNVYEYAWYALREAASPPELATANTRKVFAAQAYSTYPPIKKWVDQWDGDVVETIVSNFTGAENCFAISEIGTEVVGGFLYVSLLCGGGEGVGRTLLLRTSDPNLKSWEWVGSILPAASANDVVPGASNLSASDLFTGSDGIVRIVTSPSLNNLYQGCAVYAFEDIATGKLVDANNDLLPDVEYFIPKPSTSNHAGMCTYSMGSNNAGIIFSEQFPQIPQMRLRATEKTF